MTNIKVAIYEDNSGLREILTTIINDADGFELVGDYSHCRDILDDLKHKTPDVIIMDIDMPGKTGIEAVSEIKPLYPMVEVIMNTVFEDDDRIFQALKAGATGYLLKKTSLATLLNSIKDVYEGGAPMSPSIARRVLSMPFATASTRLEDKFNLTEREIAILKLMAKGLSYKMVADEMFISIDTVRSYVKKIYEKLHVHSVTEAVHKVFIEK